MISDIEFLKKLQKQMRYEDEFDNDVQASPRFWVVGDYKWIPTWEDSAERYSAYIPEYGEMYEISGLIEMELEDDELPREALDNIPAIGCEHSALEWIKEYIDDTAHLVPEEEIHSIIPNTMFLTKREAKSHIESNRYHYTDKVHTYAMTARRSSEVKRLFEILNKFDWDKVELKSEGDGVDV